MNRDLEKPKGDPLLRDHLGDRPRLFGVSRPHPSGLSSYVSWLLLFLSMIFGSLSSALVAAQLPLPEDEGLTGFGLALRKLPTVGSVLYITAHPDDENNALLAKLSRGQGYRTGLLSLTRGDGGQNEIGPELFEALGILRSEELMTVHRFDGAQQFFTRAFEFGYSFSVEETFQKWGREEILEDIVRVIREFRPDIILSLNPSGAGGGQHHQASALLAAEAFQLAGDSGAFPTQIESGLRPWRPHRLFQSMGIGMGSMRSGGDVTIELGEFDPLLGETYAEFGARARSNHRSQGMNILPRPGPWSASFVLANSTVESSQLKDSFFDQMDVSLQLLSQIDPSLESSVILLDGYINWAMEAYSRSDLESSIKAVMTGLDFVRRMQESTTNPESLFLLQLKEKDFLNAAEKGHFLLFDALKTNGRNGLAVPGEEVDIQATFFNRSDIEIEIDSIELLMPRDWQILEQKAETQGTRFRVRVAMETPESQPYWYRESGDVDRFRVKDGYTGIEDFPQPTVSARLTYRSFGVTATIERPVQFRWFDGTIGNERRMELKIVPALALNVDPEIQIFRTGDSRPKELRVTATNFSTNPLTATVRLEAPQGWTISPQSRNLVFSAEGDSSTVLFSVRPATGLKEGEYQISAIATSNGRVYDSGFQVISYPHIRTRHLYHPATTRVAAINVDIPAGLKVGYVMGVGDLVGRATEQLGADVTYLEESELSSGNLSQYDVIITGVRAYLNRNDLIAYNKRLLDYVNQGGHLLVQYNKYEFLRGDYAPYPLRINRPHDRVTVEESLVQLLEPNHPLFRNPNRIRVTDWDNWVQERGLYFLGQWDQRYTPLLELQDPWAYNHAPKRGSLVYTRYGKGTYVYTGLAFFRQLPAGVPGAYRIWANLISHGRVLRGRP